MFSVSKYAGDYSRSDDVDLASVLGNIHDNTNDARSSYRRGKNVYIIPYNK